MNSPEKAPLRRYAAVSASALLSLLLCSTASSGVVNLDPAFGVGGIARSTFPPSTEFAYATALQSDGKLLIAGTAGADFALVRLTPAGALDASFGPAGDGKVTTPIGQSAQAYGIARQLDGKILLVGKTNLDSTQWVAAARYLPDGSLDQTFDGDGIRIVQVGVDSPSAFGVALDASGRIVIVGDTGGASSDYFVARLLTDGTLDMTFDGDGIATTSVNASGDACYAVALQSDGKIVVAGRGGGATLLRYTETGALDTGFDTDGIVTIAGNEFRDVALQADGKIVATGGNGSDFSIMRFSASGVLDTGFDGDGKVAVDFSGGIDIATAMAIQPDGKIVASGNGPTSSGGRRIGIVRLQTNGSLDLSFDADGRSLLTNPVAVTDLVIRTDGKLIVSGYDPTGSSDFILKRFTINGSFDGGFTIDDIAGTTVPSWNDMALAPGGSILLVANSGTGCGCLARHLANGKRDLTFSEDGKLVISFGNGFDQVYSAVVQPDGRSLIAGRFGTDFGIARYDAFGNPDSSFDSDGWLTTSFGFTTQRARALVLQSDGRMVAAGTGRAGASDDTLLLARYNDDGSLDITLDGDGKLSWTMPGASMGVEGVAIQPDQKIIVVMTISSASIVARYNADGSPDTSFDGDGQLTTSANVQLRDVALMADGRIVVAGTRHNGADYDVAVVRYQSNGNLDTSFGNAGMVVTHYQGDDEGNALAVELSGAVLVAGTVSRDAFTDIALFRYEPDGSLDQDFDGDGIVATTVGAGHNNAQAVHILADGKVLAAGVAQGEAGHLLRYLPPAAEDIFQSGFE